MKVVDLVSLQGGAVIDLFDEELRRVLDNINDENTDPKKAREISIRLTIKPDKARRTAETKLEVKSKLAPFKPQESFMFFDTQDGEFVAFEEAPGPELPGIRDTVTVSTDVTNIFKAASAGR